MDKINNDNHYLSIVDNILENEEFTKIKTIEHHGISRYDHSLKVSYYSYRIAKFLKLDYIETARGGLLHDFFLSDEDRKRKERFISTFKHPKKAVENSTTLFNINIKESDIIKAHMFPINFSLPKYAESWVVNLVDKFVASMEFSKKYRYKISYIVNMYIMFFINSSK